MLMITPGSKNIYYTYHLIDPQTEKVFYVGKGKGRRAYIHLTRALKWRETGTKISGANLHLYNKLLKLHDKELQPNYVFVLENVSEIEALTRETEDILSIGIENLCNLTYGGEGETRSPQSLEKLSKSLQKFWASENGEKIKKQFSEERLGENNPMWGKIEDENHKKQRMINFLATPKWNKGLKGDPRSKGPPIGSIPHNVIACRLVNEDGRVVEAISLKELSKLSGVPITSINKLRAGTVKQNKKGWSLVILGETDLNKK